LQMSTTNDHTLTGFMSLKTGTTNRILSVDYSKSNLSTERFARNNFKLRARNSRASLMTV
jgi:hypothetical protein